MLDLALLFGITFGTMVVLYCLALHFGRKRVAQSQRANRIAVRARRQPVEQHALPQNKIGIN